MKKQRTIFFNIFTNTNTIIIDNTSPNAIVARATHATQILTAVIRAVVAVCVVIITTTIKDFIYFETCTTDVDGFNTLVQGYDGSAMKVCFVLLLLDVHNKKKTTKKQNKKKKHTIDDLYFSIFVYLIGMIMCCCCCCRLCTKSKRNDDIGNNTRCNR